MALPGFLGVLSNSFLHRSSKNERGNKTPLGQTSRGLAVFTDLTCCVPAREGASHVCRVTLSLALVAELLGKGFLSMKGKRHQPRGWESQPKGTLSPSPFLSSELEVLSAVIALLVPREAWEGGACLEKPF